MKNFFTFLILSAIFSGTAVAQSVYFRAGTSYGLPMATSIIGETNARKEVYTSTGTTSSNSLKSVKASYGSGLGFNFAFGYKLNQNFIIDLNFQYLSGRKFETGNTYSYVAVANSGSYQNNNVTTTSAKGLLFNPSVIFSAGFGKAAPYARFGLIGGTPTLTSTDVQYYNGDGVDSTIIRGEYKKGLAFGFQSAVGMNWKLSEKFDLFTEVDFEGITYYPAEFNITKNIRGTGNYKVDNTVDDLPAMSVSQKSTVYKKSYDPSISYSDPAKPTIALRESFPFSSLSVKVGVRYVLWKKAE